MGAPTVQKGSGRVFLEGRVASGLVTAGRDASTLQEDFKFWSRFHLINLSHHDLLNLALIPQSH